MNGGRQKWVDEERELTKDVPSREKTDYKVAGINESIRAFRDDVLAHLEGNNPLNVISMQIYLYFHNIYHQ